VVTRDYGELLTKWEKREETGGAMIRDAEIIFDMLPKLGESQMMFTSMILLPINFYPDYS
jgi:hypothetical protein